MQTAKKITDRAKRYRANSTARAIEWGRPRRCHYCGRADRKLEYDHIDGDEANGAKRNITLACRPCNTRKGVAFRNAGIGQATAQYNPAASQAQYRLARAVLEGRSKQMPVKVARELIEQTPRPGELAPRIARNGARSWQQYAAAVLTLSGQGQAAHMPHAIETLQNTPHKRRTELARQMKEQPIARPNAGARTAAEYYYAYTHHTRGAHDEGGRIIHETPKARRRQFASDIWDKRRASGQARRDEVPF